MTGIVHKPIAALFVLCLAAIVAVPVQADNNPSANCIKFGNIGVCPTFTSATFMTTTKATTAMTVSTGTAKSVLVATPDIHYRTRHSITVRGLAPNTRYVALVTTSPKKGKSVRQWLSFQTAAPGSAPATVTTRGNKLYLNDQRIFATMMLGLDCPDSTLVQANSSMGVLFFDGVVQGCSLNESPNQRLGDLHAAFNGQMWLADRIDWDAKTAEGLPELASWQAPIYISGAYIQLGGCPDYKMPSGTTPAGNMFKYIKSISTNKTLVFQADITDQGGTGVAHCFNAADTTVLFWTVVAGGATGIEYVTQPRVNPTAGVQLNPGVAEAAHTAATRMATLDPAILGGKPLILDTDSKSAVKYVAWKYGGCIYVIAVNTDSKATTSSFTSKSIANSRYASVLWEGRSLKVNNDSISDTFTPLAVHIYKVTPPATKK